MGSGIPKRLLVIGIVCVSNPVPDTKKLSVMMSSEFHMWKVIYNWIRMSRQVIPVVFVSFNRLFMDYARRRSKFSKFLSTYLI